MRLSRNSGKIFWGLLLILAAAYMIVGKMGILPDISIFTILLTVFLVWVMLKGIRKVSFSEILFPLAFLCILYDEQLGITALTPWTVLGAALLGSIGLGMIFKPNKGIHIDVQNHLHDNSEVTTEQGTGEKIHFENNFGESIKYINSDNFMKGTFENNFGAMSIYFDNAIIQPGGAVVYAECNFGEMQLFIPKEWRVANYLNHSFGNIRESGYCEGTSASTLTLKGEANFGEIVIHYI